MKDQYPLPLFDAAFAPLQRARSFAKLDLRHTYHLVHICKGDKWKMPFKTPMGHFMYCVMPFRLTKASVIFQALVNDVFCDLLNNCLFVYRNDILILSEIEEEHVQWVLRWLMENGLFAKPEKCEFNKTIHRPFPVRLIDGEEAFMVERILGVRRHGRGWQYLQFLGKP